MDNKNLEINRRIRQYREEKKISQEKLGAAIGMKCNAYSRMEREGGITVDDVFAIAEVLDIDPDLIFYGEKRVVEPPIFTPLPPVILGSEDPTRNTFLNDEPSPYTHHIYDGFELTNEEMEFVEIFRNLQDEKKQYVRDYLTENR